MHLSPSVQKRAIHDVTQEKMLQGRAPLFVGFLITDVFGCCLQGILWLSRMEGNISGRFMFLKCVFSPQVICLHDLGEGGGHVRMGKGQGGKDAFQNTNFPDPKLYPR